MPDAEVLAEQIVVEIDRGRADRDAEFALFMVEATPALWQTAWLLCGDKVRAEELVQDALTRTFLAWPRRSWPLKQTGGSRPNVMRASITFIQLAGISPCSLSAAQASAATCACPGMEKWARSLSLMSCGSSTAWDIALWSQVHSSCCSHTLPSSAS